jgi:hypothetical protein
MTAPEQPTREAREAAKRAVVAIPAHLFDRMSTGEIAAHLAPDFDRFAAQRAAEAVEKIAPVQGYSAGIPWSLHLRAYDAYCAKYGPQPAMIDLDGRDCRGGFAVSELDEFVPGWRDEISEIGRLKKRIAELEAQAATPPPGDAGERPQLNHGETTMMATGRYPYRKGFHWKDNWYFTRLPHGVVAIAKFTSPEAEDPEFEIKIPAEQWASIISSVSDFDETSVRYQQALDFHGAHD